MKNKMMIALLAMALAGSASAKPRAKRDPAKPQPTPSPEASAPPSVPAPTTPAAPLSPELAPGRPVPDEGDESKGTPTQLFPQLEKTLAAAYTPRKSAAFVPPTPAEATKFRDAFTLLVTEADCADPAHPTPPPLPSAPVQGALDALGFRVITLEPKPGDTVWAVLERLERPRGAGAFLIRPGHTAAPWPRRVFAPLVARAVVMAPHPRSDRGTDVMGQRIFALSRARAYLQATMHRKVPAPDGGDSDPAHRQDTFFQIATEVLDTHTSGQVFIQLHGFEATKHDDLSPDTAVIASNGRGAPDTHTPVAGALQALKLKHLGGFIAIWGKDTHTLGGTTNVQGKLINASGKNAFIHLEMSSEVRDAAVAYSAGAPPPMRSLLASLIALLD